MNNLTQAIVRLDRDSGGFQLVVFEVCKEIRECAGNALSSPISRETEEKISRIVNRAWGLCAQATVTETHGDGVDLERAASRVCDRQIKIREGVARVIKLTFEGVTKFER